MPDPSLTLAAVARRLGVAPSTLRSWERRYGLGPSGRVLGSRRRYAPDDLAKLEHMRRLTLEGVAPSDAARAALAAPDPPVGELRTAFLPRESPQLGWETSVTPRTRGLARAASALDAAGIRQLLRNGLAADGVVITWEVLLGPVLRAAADRVAPDGAGAETAALLGECALAELHHHAPEPPAPVNHRTVLLACAPGERDSLPLHAMAAALAERSVASRLLGPSLPAAALLAAVRRTGPAALVVWAGTAGCAADVPLGDLPLTRPPTAAIVAGPGWDPDGLPARATLAYDLGDAVHLVEVAVGVR